MISNKAPVSTPDKDPPNIVCPCIYDAVHPFDNYVLICLNGKWGTLDKTGKTAIPAEYAYIPWIVGDHAVVITLDRKYLIVDAHGQSGPECYPCVDAAITALEERETSHPSNRQKENNDPIPDHARAMPHRSSRLPPMAPANHGLSVHLTDEYEAALEEGAQYCAHHTNRWGLIDSGSGRLILPFLYEDINMIDRYLVKIKLNGKWGIADARLSAFFAHDRPFEAFSKKEDGNEDE